MLHRRNPERLFISVRRGVARGVGARLSAANHLHPAIGTRRKPTRCRLAIDRRAALGQLEREKPAARRYGGSSARAKTIVVGGRVNLAELSPRVRRLIERAPDAATRRAQVEDEADKLRRREWWSAQWRAVDAAADVANNPDRYEAIEAGRAALADAGLFSKSTADRLPAFADRDAARRWAWHRRRALLTLFAEAGEPLALSAAYEEAARYLATFGIEAPKVSENASETGRGTLASCVRRVTSEKWLTRRGQTAANRAGEHRQIELGRVSKRKAHAVSDAAIAAVREARARSAAALEQMELVNEDTGEILSCAEVAARSISNPKIRRGELMTRIRGIEEISVARADRCLFVTWTLPSKYHARLAADGSPNPHHTPDLSPRHGQAALVKQWARVRAVLAKRDLTAYGFRSAEPHHDGCPHWHMWLFVAGGARALAFLRSAIRREALREDGNEPGARKRRVTFKTLDVRDGGGPAAYAAKYVSKYTDGGRADGGEIGHGQTVEADGTVTRHESAASMAERVVTWARLWGIRQFQFFGVYPVGVYREARRIREPLQGELALMEPARAAADAGQFGQFVPAAKRVGLQIATEPGPEAAGLDGGYCLLTEHGERKPARVNGIAAADLIKPPRRRRRPARVTLREAAPDPRKPRRPRPGAGLPAGAGVAQTARVLVVRLAITRPHRWRLCWSSAGARAGDDVARPDVSPPWTRGNNCNSPLPSPHDESANRSTSKQPGPAAEHRPPGSALGARRARGRGTPAGVGGPAGHRRDDGGRSGCSGGR